MSDTCAALLTTGAAPNEDAGVCWHEGLLLLMMISVVSATVIKAALADNIPAPGVPGVFRPLVGGRPADG